MTITILETIPHQDAIFFMMGAIGLFIFISTFYKKQICKNMTTATVVHIIEIQKVSSHTNRTKYSPIFSYNANGKDITVHGKQGSHYYLIGDTVTLFYNNKKPEQYYIKGKIGGNNRSVILGLTLMRALIPVVLSVLKAIPK